MTAKKAEPAKIVVQAAEDMLILPFRQHVLKRHKFMRFVTKVEHAADHRLHSHMLDHIHEEFIPPREVHPVPDPDEQGEGEVHAED